MEYTLPVMENVGVIVQSVDPAVYKVSAFPAFVRSAICDDGGAMLTDTKTALLPLNAENVVQTPTSLIHDPSRFKGDIGAHPGVTFTVPNAPPDVLYEFDA